MKWTANCQRYWQSWLIAIIVGLLVASQLPTAGAQTDQNQMTITGADSKTQYTLVQPTEFLQDLGLTLPGIQQRLAPRPRIIVSGAGFVYSAEFGRILTEPTAFLQSIGISVEEAKDRLKTRTRVLVKGAGAVQSMGLASFTDERQSRSVITVRGAGSVQLSGLMILTETQTLQPQKSTISVAGAGSVRKVGLVAPERQ